MSENSHPFPLLLSWADNSDPLPKLKNKLLQHFQSKRDSNGGECEIRDTDCSRGYILVHFREEADRNRVLQKKSHDVKLGDGTTLTVMVRLPEETRPPKDTTGSAKLSYQAATHHPSPQTGQGAALVGLPTEDLGERSDQTHPVTERMEEDPPQTGLASHDWRSYQKGDSPNSQSGVGEWGGASRTGTLDSGSRDGSAPYLVTRGTAKPRADQGSGDISIGGGGGDRGPARDSTTQGEYRDNGPARDATTKGEYQNRAPARDSTTQGESRDRGLARDATTQGEYRDRGPARDSTTQDQDGHHTAYSAAQDKVSDKENLMEEENLYNKPEDNANVSPHSRSMGVEGYHPPGPFQEIFTVVQARLKADLLSETVRVKMQEQFSFLRMKKTSDGLEVTGTFQEINALYCFLQKEGAGGETSSASQGSPPETEEDNLCFSTALWEYVMEIHQTELQRIQERYKVEIIAESVKDGSTFLKFLTRESGPSKETAKDKFTETVQKVLHDWSQESVDSNLVHLPLSDIKQHMKIHYRKVQVIQEANQVILLRGPKDELSQAKRSLEKGECRSIRPPRAVAISPRDMRTEIPVDGKHLEILHKLKHRDICGIEKRYNVMMEENGKNGGTTVIFRAVNAPPDLSPHAAHSFISLLQKTILNMEKREIPNKRNLSVEDVSVLHKELEAGGIEVIMEHEGDSVLLIGHPIIVAIAEEKLIGTQTSGRDQAGGASGTDPEEPMDTSDSTSKQQKKEDAEEVCPICRDKVQDKVTFPKCKHEYCRPCLQQLMAHKPVCAICGAISGEVRGNQPHGTMDHRTTKTKLPGYQNCGTIEISYYFPGGIQQENHPHPGRSFSGTSRTAYLPDNPEGREILHLLKKAFLQQLTFTVGDSRTTSATDTVTWNDIHHKTNISGGPSGFGYPDPDYLKRVRDELKAKGIE